MKRVIAFEKSNFYTVYTYQDIKKPCMSQYI